MNILDKLDAKDMRMRVYVGAGNLRNLNGEKELIRFVRLGILAESLVCKRDVGDGCKEIDKDGHDCFMLPFCKLIKKEVPDEKD